MRSGDGEESAVLATRYPWDLRTVVEAQHELGAHPDLAPLTHDEAHDIRGLAARRHEIDQRDDAIGAGELRLEDERVAAIAACDTRLRIRGRDQPAAVL